MFYLVNTIIIRILYYIKQQTIMTSKQTMDYITKRIKLEKKLKWAQNKQKQYTKQNDRFWMVKMNYLMYDLKEKMMNLDTENMLKK